MQISCHGHFLTRTVVARGRLNSSNALWKPAGSLYLGGRFVQRATRIGDELVVLVPNRNHDGPAHSQRKPGQATDVRI